MQLSPESTQKLHTLTQKLNVAMLDGNIDCAVNFLKHATSEDLTNLESRLGNQDFNDYRSHVMALRINQKDYLTLLSKNQQKYTDFCNLMQRGANAVSDLQEIAIR